MKTAAKISPVNIKARQELDIRAGDTVKVHQKIKEGDKSRIQIFEGLVLARKHGAEAGGTFTVRKVASGVGVERIFPLFAPSIEKVEVTKRSKVRRAKLYHIREKATKEVSRQLRREVTAPETKSLAHEEVPAEEKSAE
jgi:large subunit ribosomal protein L19